MKKYNWMPIIYYLVLFGGLILLISYAVIGDKYFSNEIKNFVEKYPYIAIPSPFIYFWIYLRVIKAIVSTKGFIKWEKRSIKKANENIDKTRKKFQILIPLLGLLALFHISSCIYLCIEARNGLELNTFLSTWSMTPTCSIILFIVSIYYYNKHYR